MFRRMRCNRSVNLFPSVLGRVTFRKNRTIINRKRMRRKRTRPRVTEGQMLRLDQIRPDQHFTEPPPRYTEAALVKELEEKGIGRPSTYASIISTIVEREYVRK